MTLYPKLITDALATVRYPGTGKNLVESDMIEDDIRIDGMKVSFSIIFAKKTDPFRKSILKAAEAAIHAYVSEDVQVTIGEKYRTELPPEPDKLLSGVKNIIAVSSGKGGVGKSTVAANLAIGLVRLGYRVGLLDTDIFGPSLPKMFSVEDAQPYAQNIDGRDMILPIEKYGVKLMSIGFFINPNEAALWRGAMACNALKQFISEVAWGELDYLADLGHHRCGDCQHSPASGTGRCEEGYQHVYEREGQRADPWSGGEYGVVHSCPASRRKVLHLRQWWMQTVG